MDFAPGARWRLESGGPQEPNSWWKTILWGVVTGVLVMVAGELANSVGETLWHTAAKVSSVINDSRGNWKAALTALGLIWTFAAFGEEMGYRGYLLTRAADAGNRSKVAFLVALLGSSVLFGYGHYYKGPPGVLQSTVSGLILGGAYLLSGRNLWIPILAHGCADTIAIVAVFFGWAN
ncbi:MAG TPA: CPBP family intramembrane glutamic endopeptidase [Candidatus Acidoferrum sp.]|jgi:membrane protease YdiL (CAAX protease family)|nr:CPBP family intramembrane glutamic endopeptidase [Candidatus Acidoferrum sp.]